jgi:dTDP-4-dehydrorhamnose reductase
VTAVTGWARKVPVHNSRSYLKNPHPVSPPVEAAPEPRLIACELAALDAVCACFAEFSPTHLLHLGAVTAVGDALRDPATATRVNTNATARLAELCADTGARMVFASTDMVFDGDQAPYAPDAPTAPLSQYGRTKAAAERAVCAMPHVVIARLPLMYGFPATPRPTTFVKQAAALRSGEPLRLFVDEYRTPIGLRDAARALVALATGELTGIVHVAGPERLSRYEMGERFAAALGVQKPNLVGISRTELATTEPRPQDLSLDGSRFAKDFPSVAPGAISAETIGKETVAT